MPTYMDMHNIPGVNGGQVISITHPKLKTTLSETHQAAVLSALSRWRYEPARTPDNPVAARISSRLSLRIY